MSSQVGSIIRKSTKRENEPYNILTYCTHERAQSNLKNTNAIYYVLQGGEGFGLKGEWKECYAVPPKNHCLLPPTNNPLEAIPNWLQGFDLIISHHKFGQLQGSKQLSSYFNIPIINVEHTEPTHDSLKNNLDQFKSMKGDYNVFITEYNAKAWGWTKEDNYRVIEHGIDSNLFKPLKVKKENKALTVGNDILNRSYILGFDIFQEAIMNKGIPFKVVGDTQGFSAPAKNTYELTKFYNESLFYVNPARMSPIPMSSLEAMSCGLPVIALNAGMSPEIIVNDYNGYIVNNVQEMEYRARHLMENPETAINMGVNARNTILERFSLDRFTQNWNNLLDEAYNGS